MIKIRVGEDKFWALAEWFKAEDSGPSVSQELTTGSNPVGPTKFNLEIEFFRFISILNLH